MARHTENSDLHARPDCDDAISNRNGAKALPRTPENEPLGGTTAGVGEGV